MGYKNSKSSAINGWIRGFVTYIMVVSTLATPISTFLSSSAAAANSDVLQVSTGQTTACAVVDFKAYCWGDNTYGQLGTGRAYSSNMQTKPVAVAVNKNAVSVGSSVCSFNLLGACLASQGTSSIPASPLAGLEVDKVSVGKTHVCALAEGKVFCWGDNSHGQLGNRSNTSSSIPVAVDTSATDYTPPVVKKTCGVWPFQYSCDEIRPTQPRSNLSGKIVVDIAAGDYFTCALTNDGKVSCWGYGADGRLGLNGDTTTPTAPVSSGSPTIKPSTPTPIPTPTPTPTPISTRTPTPTPVPSSRVGGNSNTNTSNRTPQSTPRPTPRPSSSPAKVTTSNVEAEIMSLYQEGGSSVVSDSAASGGKAVRMTSNSTSSTAAQTGTLEKVSVRARGDQCLGAPNVQVKVDGKVIGTQSVSATSWKDYSFPVTLSSGNHRLDVSFTNQFSLNLLFWKVCTRALYLDKASFTSSSTAASVEHSDSNKYALSGANLTNNQLAQTTEASNAPVVRLAKASSSRSSTSTPTPTPPVNSNSRTSSGSNGRSSTTGNTTTDTAVKPVSYNDYSYPKAVFATSGSALAGKWGLQLARVSGGTMCVLAVQSTTQPDTAVGNPYCWGRGISESGIPEPSVNTVACSKTSPTTMPSNSSNTTYLSTSRPVEISDSQLFSALDSSGYVTGLSKSGKPYYWGMYGYRAVESYGSKKTCHFNSCVSYTTNAILASYSTNGTRTVSTGSGSVTPHYQGTASPGTVAGGNTSGGHIGGGNNNGGSAQCISVTHVGYTKTIDYVPVGTMSPTVPAMNFLTQSTLSYTSGNVRDGLFCATNDTATYCDANGSSMNEGQTGSSYTQSCTTTTTLLVFKNTTCKPSPTGPQKVYAAGWLSDKHVQMLDTGTSGYTCAIADGSLGCWGVNTVGQLGSGDTKNKNVPTEVTF
ncbi:MAG: hypothetical protein H6797_02695 [Candidatus Nomurabacteria bacterium]|nr:MAG: hypothetical protein H6797_02695 [Candidatus Nomurabacteria bacterium]